MRNYASQGLVIYRRKRGLKQSDLAEILGVTQGTYSRWEAGVGDPTVSMQKRIQDLLYKDDNLQIRKMVRMTNSAITGRAFSVGEDFITKAAAPMLNRALIGMSYKRLAVDEGASGREFHNGIFNGEIIGGTQIGHHWKSDGTIDVVIQTLEFSRIDGQLIITSDTVFPTKKQAEDIGPPRFTPITLDD